MSYVIGIDEVGRGPVAGPLVICACACMEGVDFLSLFPKHELRDSKKLSEKHRDSIREGLEKFHQEKSIRWGIGEVSASRIDEIGLSASIKEAMSLALLSLAKDGIGAESKVLLDGSLYAPENYVYQETHIKGDEKFVEISLASIIAKVYRDTCMKKVGQKYPLYGFENHVGYGTKMHYEALTLYGMTPQHRKSFLKKMK